MIILAEETTTLPEGATLSVVRAKWSKDSQTVGTWLLAARDRDRIRMPVDNVAAPSLRQYLTLVVREIQREQSKDLLNLTGPPLTIREFVSELARKGMFDALTNSETYSGMLGRDTLRDETPARNSQDLSRENNKAAVRSPIPAV